MLSSVSPWRSLQLGLPTPLQALSQLFPFVDIEELRIPHPYNHVGSRETESLTSLLNLTLPWTPSSSGTDTCPLLIPLVREEPLSTWNFHADVSHSFKLHRAKAFLGLAWLLAVLKLRWATAWDLVLVGKLWPGRLLETLASGVSSKSLF